MTSLKAELQKLKNPERAKIQQRFFKTGIGEYGEGDIFLGLKIPKIRQIAKKYLKLSLKDLQILLSSKIHEYRFIALVILVNQYQKAGKLEKDKLANFYLKNTTRINNWNLVDVSAPKILGDYLLDKDKKILYELAKSKNLWERRIAIISTAGFIKKNLFKDTLNIAKILLHDKHNLIHKATGWMLREVGKKNQEKEEKFLKKYCSVVPRTMLRYAIEKFSKEKRKSYLKGTPD